MAFGDKPFGINDIKLTSMTGDTQVDLPLGRQLAFNERLVTGELRGDDRLAALVAKSDAIEWSLESGGISFEAYALMTGRQSELSGTSPNQTRTFSGTGLEDFPYFKIYGKAMSDDAASDIHVKLMKCKLLSIEGTFADGEFFVTSCSGLAVRDDGEDKLFEFVQNETAADLLPEP